MKPNATLLLQIANFWITYKFLNKILLKPFVDYIDKEEQSRLLLIKNLNAKETSLIQLEEQKQLNLADFKKHIQTHYVISKPTQQTTDSNISYNIHPEKISNLALAIKKILVKAVQYDH